MKQVQDDEIFNYLSQVGLQKLFSYINNPKYI